MSQISLSISSMAEMSSLWPKHHHVLGSLKSVPPGSPNAGGGWTKGPSCWALTPTTGFKPRPHSLDHSQRLLTAGIPRQAHFWKTQDSSEGRLWLEVSLWVLPTSLEQCCGLRCSLSHSHGAAMSWWPVSSVSRSFPFSLCSICPLQLWSHLSFFFF